MKTLRIRRFLLAGLLLMIILPRMFYIVTDFVFRPIADHKSQSETALADQVIREMTQSTGRWNDPDWQKAFQNRYQSAGVAVFAMDASGKQIFRMGHYKPNQFYGRQVTVVENGKIQGTLKVFIFNHHRFFAMLSTIFAVILAICLIGWLMGRYILKPLAAMSSAARQIAKGNLDFKLPASRLTEVADVGTAFETMGDSLRESLIRQANLEEERRFFITAIAHDLRTPLFVLRGYLLRLEQSFSDAPEKTARYISVCRQKSEQLERLISDLFAYAKTEYKEQAEKDSGETFAFGSWMEEMTDHFRLMAKEKNINIVLSSQEEVCLVKGDKHLLERAVGNLMDNAVHYTPPGGQIMVKWHSEEGRAFFTITDTGPGIPDPDLPHIFDPFFRADKSRNTKTGGTGLGVTIAKRILNAHGGDLSASNHPSKGAEFTGWLPLIKR